MALSPEDFEAALIAQLPEETLRFLAVFARFDYALKRSEFLENDPPGSLSPTWDRFANTLGPPFFVAVQEKNDLDEFLAEPPKSQKPGPGGIKFSCVRPAVSAQDLFGAVRRCRNNLFHGEKYSNLTGPDGPRDARLIVQALAILRLARAACLRSPDGRLRRVAERLEDFPHE